MDKTARTAHATHDELLIARLYGGDVSEIEHARAQDLVARCSECGALLADLRAIAAANAGLPVPPRPRDFSLTETDAARLRQESGRRLANPWPQFRRSFGAALTTLGLAGLVLTASLSMLGGGATAGTMAGDQAAASYAANRGGAGPAGGLSEGSYEPLAPAATAAGSVGGAIGSPLDYSASQTPESQATSKIAAAGTQSIPATEGQPSPPRPTGQPGEGGGIDARLVWLGGFGALFVIGLAILLVPRLACRRRRGAE